MSLQSAEGDALHYPYHSRSSIKGPLGRRRQRIQVRPSHCASLRPATTDASPSLHSPERWMKGSVPEVAHHIPGVWGNLLTFLGGPRACIGFRFSLVECVTLLHAISTR